MLLPPPGESNLVATQKAAVCVAKAPLHPVITSEPRGFGLKTMKMKHLACSSS